MYRFDTNGQMTMLGLDTAERGGAPPKRRSGKPDSELVSIPYFHLDLLSSPVDLFGQRHWEFRSPWREGKRPLNTGAAPRRPIRVSLSGILEAYPSLKYYLSKTACLGILRRAFERGKDLPKMLARALKIQAGLMRPDGQLTNMQMQTFVTQPNGAGEGFDGYNGVMAFAANQRDEVRDLHDVAGALGAQPGMKQQTFVAGFSAGAGASAGGIGYNESVAPTLKGSPGGNCMPSVLCLNDQGGSVMECSENVSGTLRAQEHGHQPLVYENHGIDSRYTGPHKVVPTMSARYGTGGNNIPLVEQNAGAICIAGNIVDRQPQNGGNGLGCQENLAYTLTATDRHAVVELYQKTVGALCRGDEKGIGNQYVSQDKCIINASCSETHHLIRRLTPLECERLQGFPDHWTDLGEWTDSKGKRHKDADSPRYKALGNSIYLIMVVMRRTDVKTAPGEDSWRSCFT